MSGNSGLSQLFKMWLLYLLLLFINQPISGEQITIPFSFRYILTLSCLRSYVTAIPYYTI